MMAKSHAFELPRRLKFTRRLHIQVVKTMIVYACACGTRKPHIPTLKIEGWYASLNNRNPVHTGFHIGSSYLYNDLMPQIVFQVRDLGEEMVGRTITVEHDPYVIKSCWI